MALPFTINKSILNATNYEIIPSARKVLPYNESSFLERWRDLTAELCDGLDWSNVVIAGGSIWRCINNSMSRTADIDFFIYGADTEARAAATLNLCKYFATKFTAQFHVYGSVIDVTGFSQPIQIICTNKKKPTRIVKRFVKAIIKKFGGVAEDDCWLFEDIHRSTLERTLEKYGVEYNLVR